MTAVAAPLGSLRRFRPTTEAPVRLVCFPHAGGAATAYLPLARALEPEVDTLAMQYPGRQDRRHEPCLESVDALADAALEAVLGIADRPFALFGHSMGASVAFEVTHRLRREGLTPTALFVSGRTAPSCMRTDRVHMRGDDALLAEIAELGGTDRALLESAEIRRMVLPALRADYRAAESYRWSGGEPPLTIPLHVHVGDRDPKVRVDEARAWRAQTDGRFTLTTYPGGHFYLAGQVGALGAAVGAELAAA